MKELWPAVVIAVLISGCGSNSEQASTRESAPDGEHTESHAAPHWGYGPDDGPGTWAELSPEWVLCAEGHSQSPIDIRGATRATEGSLDRRYRPASLRIAHHEHLVDIINNGHTIQVTYDEGSWIETDDLSFELKQFHFHAPSEHTLEGRRFPLEMHLVHASPEGELAVMGVFIEEGEHDADFDVIWEHLPDRPGEEQHLEHVEVDIDALLPESVASYRYEGSLTTPPCSEGVHWFVLVQPIELSAEQIEALRSRIDGNNRAIQELHGRSIVQVDAPE